MPIIEHKANTADCVHNILFVGAIQREKGIVELMEAFNELRKKYRLRLNICGLVNDSTIEKAYRDFCFSNSLCVNDNGYVSGKIKEELFSKSDIFVLPSYHEGMPLVILEALASGCAIVTTPVGAIPEILNDENALWSKVGDTYSLCNCLKTLFDNQELLRKMQLSNIKKSYSFTLDEHLQKLCSLYINIQSNEIN